MGMSLKHFSKSDLPALLAFEQKNLNRKGE